MEQTVDTLYIVDKFQNNYAQWKKPDKTVCTGWFHILVKFQ